MKALPYSTIDEYIALQPTELRPLLESVRQTIRDAAPDAAERISWGMPTFHLHENLAHFALFKKHIGLFPGPEGIERFQDRFASEGLKWSKGTVQFPLDRPLPLDLVREIVIFRAGEARLAHEARQSAKRAR